jgi:stringent starvation protein B
MAKPPTPAPPAQGTSTRPYLIRALHDWCTDNGFTPYVAVFVDGTVRVPMEYVKNNEIVLNVGFEATSGLKIGNEFIEFRARFGGAAREIVVPVDHVVAIYARENGQGMAFPVPAGGGEGGAAAPSPIGGAGEPAPAGAAADGASRGLRLASDSPPPPAPAGAGSPAPPAGEEPPRPDAPGPAGGKRPSLKRVK